MFISDCFDLANLWLYFYILVIMITIVMLN